MRIFVLGAAGMLGSAVARKAAKCGHEVHALVRPETDLERLADCADAMIWHRHSLQETAAVAAVLERHAPQAIVHASFSTGHAHTSEARAQMLQNSLSSSLGLLEVLLGMRFDGSLVYLGSAMSYGATGVPHHPSSRLQPCTFRGVVKAAESLMFAQFAREIGCSLTELRLFSVYGPWEQRTRLLPRLFAAALGGPLVRLTARPHLRDWVYVDDAIEACLQACRRAAPRPEIFNVCTGQLHSSHALAQMVERMVGRRLIDDDIYTEGDAYGDPLPAGVPPDPDEGFDWQPRHDIESGLAAYWRWAASAAGRAYLLSSSGKLP